MKQLWRGSPILAVAFGVAAPAAPQSTPDDGGPGFVTETLTVSVFPGQQLTALLTLPHIDAPPYPAALVLTVREPGAATTAPALVLAESLLARGVAVVRLDVPPVAAGAGAGESMDQPADDAFAVLQFLREREDIDGDRIAIVGVGAAARYAARAAALDEPARALVLLGAAPVDSDTLGLPTALPLLSLPLEVRVVPGRDAGEAPSPVSDAAAFLVRHLQ